MPRRSSWQVFEALFETAAFLSGHDLALGAGAVVGQSVQRVIAL